MTFREFEESISTGNKAGGMNKGLESLYEDARGDWNHAHEIAQNMSSVMGDRIHAYLHRKEGDRFNASYWYNRSGEKFPQESLEKEWKKLVLENL